MCGGILGENFNFMAKYRSRRLRRATRSRSDTAGKFETFNGYVNQVRSSGLNKIVSSSLKFLSDDTN